MDLKYGTDYPEACPPISAKPIEGAFYRLCDSNPPTENDFKTHVDLNLKFIPAKLCEAKALSFLRDKQSVEAYKKRFRVLRKKTEVLVDLKLDYGLADEFDENGHFNFWEFKQVNFLENVEEEEENEADKH